MGIKLGFLPIGQKRVPVIGDIRAGSPVKVSYNPEDPAEAFISCNCGKSNV